MQLDFYYYSYQCPLNDNMLQYLDEFKSKIKIHCYDISKNPSLAKEMKMFYPTLTVLNQNRRYYSPLGKSFLDEVSNEIYPEETPYLPKNGVDFIEEIIEPLTLDKIKYACACCGNETKRNSRNKQDFLSTFPQDIYGYIHKDKKGNLLGGVEYLPSEIVPYDIPHEKDTAFITCLYLTDTEYDFKSAPLKKTEDYLKCQYKRIIAITDEIGIFPNGDLEFFLKHGYSDIGIVFEDSNYCRLHLVSKFL